MDIVVCRRCGTDLVRSNGPDEAPHLYWYDRWESRTCVIPPNVFHSPRFTDELSELVMEKGLV